MDYLFLVSVESWLKRLDIPDNSISRTYDIPLRRQLVSGDVILTISIVFDEGAAPHFLLPVADYLPLLPGKLSDVGLTNFFNDRDGVIRRFVPPLLKSRDKNPCMTLAGKLPSRMKKMDFRTADWDSPKLIGFVGPPGTIPRLSMSRLLSQDAKNDASIRKLVNQKEVIVVAENSKGQDLNLTPYARPFLRWEGDLMSGAEVYANIVESLLSERWHSVNFRCEPTCLWGPSHC